MTSPAFRPSQPVSSSWAPQGGWYNAGQQSQQAPNNQQAVQQAQADAQRADQYVQQIVAAINAANTEGNQFKKDSLRAQYEDAEKGRQNAWKIVELQTQANRYGTDRQTEVSLAQLKENQRQFEQNHGLEMQKFGLEQQKYGLDVSNAYANYADSYDKIWALNDFEAAMGRVGQGLGVQPLSADNTPHAKTWEDFAALSGYDNLPAVQTGTSAYMGSGGGAPATGMAEGPGSGTASSGADPRLKAIRAVADAMPPSDSMGHDDQDWAALDAIKNVWFAAKPGQVERLGKERRKMGMAGLRRAGFNANLVEEDRIRNGVGQGAVGRA